MTPSRTSRRFSRWISAVVGLILLGLGVRLGWTVWRSETGRESVWNQWRAASVGWFVEPNPLYERLPVDQTKFWLMEVERVVAEHPSDPEVLMGAALVLDSPCSDFEAMRFLTEETYLGGMRPPYCTLNSEGIRLANLEYEHLCGARCAELAHSAQQFGPEKLNMSRLASLLLFKSDGYYNCANPRTSQWIARLEEYGRVDSENGLYEYLAAIADWEESLRLDWNRGEGDSRLVVSDAARFERGAQAFSRGQQRHFVSMGAHESTVIAKFLALTSLSPLEKEKVLHGRNLTTLRRSYLFRAAWRWQWELARSKREKEDDRAAAIELLRQDLRFIDQYVAGEEVTQFNSFVAAHRTLTLNTIREILRENAGQFGEEALAKCDRELVDSKLEEAVMRAAATRLEASDTSRPAKSLILEKPALAAVSLVVGLASQFAIILLVVFGIAVLLARCFTTPRPAEMSWWMLGLAFPLASMLSVALLGLAPAEVIPVVAQQWIATIVILIGPLVIIAIVVARWFRAGSFQFSLSKLFWMVTFVSLYLGLSVFARQFEAFAQIPFDLAVPSSSTHATQWLNLKSSNDALTLFWRITFEWLAYRGPYVTLGLWGVILLLGAWMSMRRIGTSNERFVPRLLSFCGNYLRTVARSSVWLIAFSLVIYGIFAPPVLQLVERDYQWKMSFVHNPNWRLNRARIEHESIRADTKLMKELQEQVAEVLAREDQEQQ